MRGSERGSTEAERKVVNGMATASPEKPMLTVALDVPSAYILADQAAIIADCHQVRGDTSDAMSQDVPRRPAHVVAGRERHLDHPKLIVCFRLELEDNAALVERFRLQDDVVLTAAVDVGNRVT